MVEECIAKIVKLRTHFLSLDFFGILCFIGFLGSVLANQPTVHSLGVSKGSVAVAVAAGDR